MKINKLYASIALTSALALTGCGGDDDGEYVAGGSDNGGPIVNNELNYAAFDMFNDVVDGKYKNGWGKIAFKLNSDSLIQTTSTVVGSSPTAYQDSQGDEDDHHDYYAADRTFAKVSDQFDKNTYKIKFIGSDSFSLRIQTDNRPIDSVYDIKTLDLSGVKKLGGNVKAGIQTDLDYDYFPSNISFPKGSECYIFQETPSQSYYTFYDLASREDISIAQWIINEKKNNTVNNLIEEKVGKNNELSAARYTDEDGDIIAAIEYNGLVYDAYYYQKGVTEDSNIDFTTDFVNCDQYNTVAANFLEEQIKINYNK